jgi:hypothetical protein
VSHDEKNWHSDARQTSRLWHRRTSLFLAACKANISLEVAPGLVHRRAAVGVGILRDMADGRTADPHASVAQALNQQTSVFLEADKLRQAENAGGYARAVR